MIESCKGSVKVGKNRKINMVISCRMLHNKEVSFLNISISGRAVNERGFGFSPFFKMNEIQSFVLQSCMRPDLNVQKASHCFCERLLVQFFLETKVLEGKR